MSDSTNQISNDNTQCLDFGTFTYGQEMYYASLGLSLTFCAIQHTMLYENAMPCDMLCFELSQWFYGVENADMDQTLTTANCKHELR